MRHLLLACVVLAAFAADHAAADTVTITGTVKDFDDNPIAGMEVAATWLEGKAFESVLTKEDGGFEIEVRSYGRPVALMMMDKERKRGAVAVVKDSSRPVNVFASDLVRVHGTFACTDLGAKPSWTNVYVNLLPLRVRAARHSSNDAEFSFHLPTGRFQLYMYGTDVKTLTRTIDVDTGEGLEMDLGEIDLKATPIAKLYGKELPPWNVTDARGVDKDVKLADYTGKWVLLEFWFST